MTSAVARRTRLVPVAFAAGTTVVAIAALVVMAAAGGDVVESHLVVDVVVGSVSAVLGALLVSRLPRNPMGWLFALSGAAYVVSAAVTAWVAAARAWQWPGLLAAAWTSEWLYVLALGPQITLLLLLFPDGAPPSNRWRPLVWTASAADRRAGDRLGAGAAHPSRSGRSSCPTRSAGPQSPSRSPPR